MPVKKPLSPEAAARKCARCGGACCRYITVSIPAPRSMLDFDNLIWQLHHPNVNVLKDADGWSLLINTICKNLAVDGKCMIYPVRPVTCREHSASQCEYDDPLHENAELYFPDAESMLTYCDKRFKNWGGRFKGYDA